MCILQQNLTDQDDRFVEPLTAGNPLSRGEENPCGLRRDPCRQDLRYSEERAAETAPGRRASSPRRDGDGRRQGRVWIGRNGSGSGG
ncbi:hypothetical protein Misp03_59860 [Microbispora sp. NBRC 16548]|nr:hypothetical protein Misp03_59860 [Microbispora sp. NBRC 16548]